MDQVSRPMQIVLVVTLAFAAVWMVALRPKAAVETEAPTPSPAPTAQPATPPAKKSAVPGAAGDALDKARATRAQALAGTRRAAAAAPRSTAAAAPRATAAAPPTGGVPPVRQASRVISAEMLSSRSTPLQAGAMAVAMFGAALQGARLTGDPPRAAAASAPRAAAAKLPNVTPGMVRAALARRSAVVLLFYSGRASDDRAVRRELVSVSRRSGRVRVWPVGVGGLARFKNVLRGTQVLQTPSVVVLGPARPPQVMAGYIDAFEIDQAAAVSLGA